MNSFEITILIAACILCSLLGHIIGYRTRIKDETIGRISLVFNKDDIEVVKKALLMVYYKGKAANDVEIRAIDVNNPSVAKTDSKNCIK